MSNNSNNKKTIKKITNKSNRGFKKKHLTKDLIVNGEERKKKVIRMRRVTKPISRLANRHPPSQTNKSSKGFKKKHRAKDLIVKGEERKKKVIRMRRLTKPISRLANRHPSSRSSNLQSRLSRLKKSLTMRL